MRTGYSSFVGMAALAAGAVLLAGSPTVAVPAGAAQPWRYRVLDLGFTGSAAAINEHGDVVGSHEFVPNLRHPYLWRHGRLTDLGEVGPRPAVSGEATDVNNRGQVVGYSNVSNKQPRIDRLAFIWQHGVIAALNIPGTDSVATAINDRGQVVGSYTTDTGTHAFLWQHGVLTDLGPGQANDINDRGQIVGSRYGPRQVTACMWYRGEVTDLAPGQPFDRAAAVDNRGRVIGTGYIEEEGGMPVGHGYLWRSGTLTDLGVLGVGHTSPSDLNDRGVIVGTTGLNNAFEPIPFIWRNGVMADLRPYGVPSVAAINSRGQLLGGHIDPDGQLHIAIYTP